MIEKRLYSTLEIAGTFLVPGFSIYVLEIKKENEKWFYIGMTGDPHYPSARAAFYRISGHLELKKRSTQNQLRIALRKELGIIDDKDLEKIVIKMYHYPIQGFKKITDKILDDGTVKQIKPTEGYKNYKTIQQKVLALENELIFVLKDKLLNKTKGKKIGKEGIPFPEIYQSIINLVSNE